MNHSEIAAALLRTELGNITEELREALSNGWEVRSKVVSILASQGESVIPKMQKLLLSDIYPIRKLAYDTLSALQSVDQIQDFLLKQLSTNPEVKHRQVTVWMLREMGRRAKPCSANLARLSLDKSEDILIKHEVLQALHRIDPESVPLECWAAALSSYSIKNFERLFWLANDYLVAAGELSLPILAELLEQEQPDVRVYAAGVLAKLSSAYPEARIILEQTKNDPCWYVRQAAAYGLGERTPERNNSEEAFEQVEISEADTMVIIHNGLIRLGINKETGIVNLFEAYGQDLLGPKGRIYYDTITPPGRAWWPKPDGYKIRRFDGNFGHVVFTKTATERQPFDINLNFVVERGSSGFYFYVTYCHNVDIPVRFVQARHVLRFDSDKLKYMAINDNRMGRMPSTEMVTAGEEVMDATFRLGDGSVYSKYNWQVFEGLHLLHGIMGENIGLWMMSASKEFYNGGPFKQNRTVHYDNVLLQIMQSGHFGAGGHWFPPKSGWRKIYGPHFIYVNQGENLAELWIDAKTRAYEEKEKWPYQWVNEELYPLKRTSVAGQIEITDGSSAADGWIILGDPDPHWQHQGKGYLFYTKTDADGRFTLQHVRPGTYTLWAYVPGVVGEFRLDSIEVRAAEAKDLGVLKWSPEKHGDLIWRIGVPDRTGAEFFIPGKDYRNWGMWFEYDENFPDGVVYTIGKSDYRTDWNYCQPITVLTENGPGDAKPWEIRFNLDHISPGKAYLTIGIAASTENVLAVTVNGQQVGIISRANDNATYRSSIRGIYSHHVFEFDTSLLVTGENLIGLTVTGDKGIQRGIIYDFLQLEIDHFTP